MLPAGFATALETNGYVVIDHFIPKPQCDELVADVQSLIEQVPEKSLSVSSHHWEKKSSSRAESQKATDYFLESADRVGFFMKQGFQLGGGTLGKYEGLGRIGYGIHTHRPAFRSATFTQKTRAVFTKLNFVKPVVVQSQFISDAVGKHQDLTYMYVEPPEKLVSCWICLNDDKCDQCGFFLVPKSHKGYLVFPCFFTLRNKFCYKI